MDSLENSITRVPGVRCAAGSLGIKRDEAADAALFVVDRPARYAAVFTANQFRSACVDSASERLHAGGTVRAVLVTSGNANTGTGVQGRADTERLAAKTAEVLGCASDEIVVLHTGVIGVPLRVERLEPRIAGLAAALDSSPEAGAAAARAMMTTDTFPKMCVRKVTGIEARGVIGGVAKGAGMIHPRLATMLAVIATDLPVRPAALQSALRRAVNASFNRISVDGDTSPNDSVILLATGSAAKLDAESAAVTGGFHSSGDLPIGGPSGGPRPDEPALDEGMPDFETFCLALEEVCLELAQAIVRDGEGATKFIEIQVTGAASEADAERVAATVATSPLVKTAFFGEDFNPGRIVSAAGRSGAVINWDAFIVRLGGIPVFDAGRFLSVDPETARAVMRPTDILLEIHLGAGENECRFFTCDLTYDYVRINGEYTT